MFSLYLLYLATIFEMYILFNQVGPIEMGDLFSEGDLTNTAAIQSHNYSLQ